MLATASYVVFHKQRSLPRGQVFLDTNDKTAFCDIYFTTTIQMLKIKFIVQLPLFVNSYQILNFLQFLKL